MTLLHSGHASGSKERTLCLQLVVSLVTAVITCIVLVNVEVVVCIKFFANLATTSLVTT